MTNFINRLSKKNFAIYSLSLSIILVFLPWLILYLFLNSRNLLYSGFKYGGIAIITSLISLIFYEKNKKIVFWIIALILITFALITLKNLFLAIFFTGLGHWTLG